MKTTAFKSWSTVLIMLFYDFAVGGLHLALMSSLTLHLYWSAYSYLETGVHYFDAQTQIVGMAVVLISSIECGMKAGYVYGKLADILIRKA